MRKFGIILLAFVFLSGCATYKYHHGKTPYDKGYVVAREDYTILEYTLGKDNTVPNLDLAKERFKRRRDVVEDYYKRMGFIENRAKMTFWDPAAMFLKLVGGIFYLPFAAVSEFRYSHDAAYKAKIDKMDADREAAEATRIKALKEKLNVYVQQDLDKEASMPLKPVVKKERKGRAHKTAVKIVAPASLDAKIEEKPSVVVKEEPVAVSAQAPKEESVAVPVEIKKEESVSLPVEAKIEESVPSPVLPEVEKTVSEQPKINEKQLEDLSRDVIQEKTKPVKVETIKVPNGPIAVIVAVPVQGYSPLKVRFSGNRSYASKGRRIIAYSWDFGDGDSSNKESAVNTFYSTSFQPRDYNVTLTVQDDIGGVSTVGIIVQVLNK